MKYIPQGNNSVEGTWACFDPATPGKHAKTYNLTDMDFEVVVTCTAAKNNWRNAPKEFARRTIKTKDGELKECGIAIVPKISKKKKTKVYKNPEFDFNRRVHHE